MNIINTRVTKVNVFIENTLCMTFEEKHDRYYFSEDPRNPGILHCQIPVLSYYKDKITGLYYGIVFDFTIAACNFTVIVQKQKCLARRLEDGTTIIVEQGDHLFGLNLNTVTPTYKFETLIYEVAGRETNTLV